MRTAHSVPKGCHTQWCRVETSNGSLSQVWKSGQLRKLRRSHSSDWLYSMTHIQEDAGEAIESSGFLAMARPWRYSRKLKAALLAEFVGMAIFQIYGGNSPDSGEGSVASARWSRDDLKC